MNLGLSGRDLVGPIGVAAGVVFAVLFVKSCNDARDARAQLGRERDAEKLRDGGVQVEEPVDVKTLKADLAAAEQENAAFKAAVEAATAKIKALEGRPPKTIEVIRYVTKPGHAGGEAPTLPTEAPGFGTTGRGEARDVEPGSAQGSPTSTTPPSCLVSPGDTMQIAVSEATLETKSGNRIVTGSAACRRLQPPPETTIYEAPIAMNLVKAEELETKAPAIQKPWIAGVIGSTNGKSYGVGPSVGYAGPHFVATLGGTFGSDSRAIASVHGRF